MLIEKFFSFNSDSDSPRDPRMIVVVRFTILILVIHSINTLALFNSIADFCVECMLVVYLITGIPLLVYLFKLDYLAKALFCLLLPVSLYFFYFYVGVTYKSEIVYLPFLFLTFYLFNRFIERIVISFIYILCYIGIINQINIFNIQPKGFELPEEALVGNMIFLGCFGIIFIFCQYFFSTINSYKLSTSKLLNDLKEQNVKLETANEDLERFNYITSHDLKSPLRNISSFINLLERDLKRKRYENLEEYLGFIKSGSNNMYQLIEDILKYSQIKDVSEREKEKLCLSELCDQFNNDFRDQIIYKELPIIYESRHHIKTIFQNIIENGLKYNKSEHPKIRISCEYDTESFNLIFEDNGIGIESRFHNQIFDMFKRLHSIKEYDGTGLGLAIVKRISEQLNAKITVKSAVEKGTTFALSLPKKCLYHPDNEPFKSKSFLN